MKQQKRKGFTLVELLVVIAILSVLATVSIVGYTQFIKKAHISNDLSLITQINRGLEADEIASGKPATLHEARTVLAELGYDLPKLTPSAAGHNYVWNYETNRFLLINDKLAVVAPEGAKLDKAKSFAVAHNQAELEKWQGEGFSIYLADDFKLKEDNTTKALTVANGIDTGNCTAVKTINYVGEAAAKEVNIRTNGQTLNVTVFEGTVDSNYVCDKVNHFGYSEEIVGEKFGNASFHEFGLVGFVTIKSGKLVAENGGEISVVQRTTTDATVELNGGVIKSSVATSEELKTEIAGVECQIKTEEEITKIKEDAIQENIMNTVDFTDSVARIGRTGYKTLDEAFKNAANGDTVVLLKDIPSQSQINIGNIKDGTTQKLTLDLNGKSIYGAVRAKTMFRIYADLTIVGEGTISSSDDYNFYILNVNGKLTIDGPTIQQTGNRTSSDTANVIKVSQGAEVILESGTIWSALPTPTIYVEPGTVNKDNIVTKESGSFSMDGGTVENTYEKTSQNAAAIKSAGKTTIKVGSTVLSKNAPIYVVSEDAFETVIEGGTFVGGHTIWNEKGIVRISGGKFEGTAGPCVYNCNEYSKTYITGGNFEVTAKSDNTYALNIEDNIKNSLIEVTGGTFHGYDPQEFVDTTKCTINHVDGETTWTVVGK